MVNERAQAIMKDDRPAGKGDGFNFVALAAVALAIGGLYGGGLLPATDRPPTLVPAALLLSLIHSPSLPPPFARHSKGAVS